MRRAGGRGASRRDNARFPKRATPLTILGASLIKWHAADDPAMVLNAGNVSSWPCKVNNGALVQATAANQPLFEAAGYNGHASVKSDGTNDWLGATLTTAIAAGSRPYLMMAAQYVALSARLLFIFPDGSGGTWKWDIYDTGSGFHTEIMGSAGEDITGPTRDTNRHVFETGYLAVTTARFVVDGTGFNGAATGTNNGGSTFDLFANSDGSSGFCNARIAEVLISSTPPSAAQLAALRAYFAARYV